MNAKNLSTILRQTLAKHSRVVVVVAVLMTAVIAILARGDRDLRINIESEGTRLEINSSPWGDRARRGYQASPGPPVDAG